MKLNGLMGWLVDNRLDEIDVLMKTWNTQYHLHPEMSYELDPNFIITKKNPAGWRIKPKPKAVEFFENLVSNTSTFKGVPNGS